MGKRAGRLSFWLLLLAWLTAIVLGFRFLSGYEGKAGSGAAVASFPQGLSPALSLDPSRKNLILVAHPRCPCTGATLDELIEIMTACRNELHVSVLFTVPAGESQAGWVDSHLEREARRIPGVTVVDDPDGKMAARLGAAVSGVALLFDGRGKLLFSGGITEARGHRGPNDGRESVIALVQGRPAAALRTPVFGCALVGSGLQAGMGNDSGKTEKKL
ncbi:hypothetical protein SAMN05444156_2228 [Verrucomicrobium sp. GAS474]|uniref:hypothetical protein n=1 Tax=Verrucomicrobium sp. GAS474 TaxID=1882831 RepID=UPI00087CA2BA|nr:hypothetical protein [Verrucomicrobium sp. GAS474]SDU14483.1 hypothetical protein SAMN05444156_2228 [Verrucomicrobium sp. GAS474]